MTRQWPTVDPARMRTSNRDRAELHARLGAWFAQTLGPESNPRLSPLVSPGKAGMSSETLLFDMLSLIHI